MTIDLRAYHFQIGERSNKESRQFGLPAFVFIVFLIIRFSTIDQIRQGL